MLLRRSVIAALGVVCLVPWVGAQRASVTPSVDLVELDVSVLDGKGRAVSGLSQDDFVIKEDGRRIDITTFSEIAPGRGDAQDSIRSIVILLDDLAIPPAGSNVIQQIARAIVKSAAPRDEVSVVRLHNRADEPFGDRRLAETRIAEYRAGAAPYVEWITPEVALERLAEISEQLSVNEGRRKTVICVGSPVVCNFAEPVRTAPREIWPRWVNMLSSSARANVGVYAIVPARITLRGGGIAQFTGGEVFATNYDVGPAIDRILQDANHYYLVGYWPPESKPRELHSIDVTMNGHGLKARVRRQRGA